VRRMASLSAQRLGLDDIGQISEGAWADLVVFDPQTVADNTTPEQPDAPPTGIETVFISGQPVVRNGKTAAQQRRGRVLRK
jgi:N-acyl-D-amino-acid deacylase